MKLPIPRADHTAVVPPSSSGPLRVGAAAAGRSRVRERAEGIAMGAYAAGESVLAGLRIATAPGGVLQTQPAAATALALSDGTQISFSRITKDSLLEPA